MEPGQELRDALLEAQTEAALGGHNIGAFEPVTNGHQATCQHCGMTSWVGQNGLRYSLQEDSCLGQEKK